MKCFHFIVYQKPLVWGFQRKKIGDILSGSGLFFIAVQYFLLTGLVDRFGFYNALRIGTYFSVPIACLIPMPLITNEDAPEGTLTLTSLAFLSAVYGVIRSFSSVLFSTITMTTNRTVPADQRATMNGLCMLGGSLAKAIGPLFGGILFSKSVNHITPPFGLVFVFGVLSVLDTCLGVQAFFLQEYDPHEESAKITEDEQEPMNSDYEEEEEEAPPTF